MPDNAGTATVDPATTAVAGTTTAAGTTNAAAAKPADGSKDGGTILGTAGTKVTNIDYKLELPKDSLLDKEAVERTVAFARERGLTNDQATEYLKYESEAVARFSDARMKQYDEMKAGWLDEAKKDKELGGGDNTKWTETVAVANRVIERFAPEGLREKLDETGFGNHPLLIKLFRNIGLAMKSDRAVTSGSPPSTGKSNPLDKMFPTTAKKED